MIYMKIKKYCFVLFIRKYCYYEQSLYIKYSMCNLIKNYKTLKIKKNKPKQVVVVLIKFKV